MDEFSSKQKEHLELVAKKIRFAEAKGWQGKC